MKPPARQATRIALAACGVTALLLVRLPDSSRVVQELENAGHAALFGAVALFFVRDWKGSIAGYARAAAGTTLLGILTELVQKAAGLDFELLDVVRDAAGAAAFLAVAWTLHHRPPRLLLVAVRLSAVALISAVFVPPVHTLLALAHRWRTFPTIADPESLLERRLITDSKEVCVEPVPATAGATGDAVRVTFTPQLYSGWGINGPFPSWRGYRQLSFSVISALESDVLLNLRVHDRAHNNDYHDRFNTTLEVRPGVNRFGIPLPRIERSPRGRVLDLNRVDGIGMFVVRPPKPFDLYFRDFRLER